MEQVLFRRAQPREPLAIATPDPVYRLDMAFVKLPIELWIVIIRMLETQRSIRSFSESASFFHRLAAPILFEKIRLTRFNEFVDPKKFQNLLSIRYLSYVRELRVEMGAGPTDIPDPLHLARLYEIFNWNLREAISKMTNLVSFSYGTLSLRQTRIGPRGYCESHAVPLLNNTLIPLRANRRLRNLSIVMHGYADIAIQCQISRTLRTFEEWALYIRGDSVMLDFSGFRNLTSLQLFDIAPSPDDPTMLALQLARTLIACPRLQTFGIGFHLEHYHKRFLPVLWDIYQMIGGEPLSLKTLYIREGCTERPNSNIPYSEEVEIDGFTNTSKLTTLIVEYNPSSFRGTPGTPDGITLENDSLIHYCDHLKSITKFSTKFFDSKTMDFLSKVCDDVLVSSNFMSELHFDECVYTSNDKHRLRFSDPKQKFWPKVFSIQSFVPENRAEPAVRRQIIRAMYKWKGLERLHLPLDLGITEQRRMARTLVKSLKYHNLKVVIFKTVRSFTRLREDFESGGDMCAYLENQCGQRFQRGVYIISEQQLECVQDRLAFTKSLSMLGNVKYLGVFNTIFKTHIAQNIYKTPSQNDYPNLFNDLSIPYKVNWLQQLTFSKKEYDEFSEILTRDGIP